MTEVEVTDIWTYTPAVYRLATSSWMSRTGQSDGFDDPVIGASLGTGDFGDSYIVTGLIGAGYGVGSFRNCYVNNNGASRIFASGGNGRGDIGADADEFRRILESSLNDLDILIAQAEQINE